MQATIAKPRPKIDTVSRGFWDNARAGKLSIQTCAACGDGHFPGSPVCPKCLSEDQSWVQVSGRGTLLSWVRFHRAYWDSFRSDLPYLVCLVGLEEGPMLVSNLVGVEPEDIVIGAEVEAVFEKVDDELTLPKFRMRG
ncbi:MAG: Zn-ribbon domain-containing OB-fold protein [Pseudomonadota bacterium]